MQSIAFKISNIYLSSICFLFTLASCNTLTAQQGAPSLTPPPLVPKNLGDQNQQGNRAQTGQTNPNTFNANGQNLKNPAQWSPQESQPNRFGNNDLRGSGEMRANGEMRGAGQSSNQNGGREFDSSRFTRGDSSGTQLGDRRQSNSQTYGSQIPNGQDRQNLYGQSSYGQQKSSIQDGAATPKRDFGMSPNAQDLRTQNLNVLDPALPPGVPNRQISLNDSNVILDSNVKPVSFLDEQTLNTNMAEQLLKLFDINKIQTALPGDPISLVDAIATIPNDKHQRAILSYWDTYSSYIKMRFAEEEFYWLEQLQSPVGQADQSLLKLAKMNGQNRALQAEVKFLKSQGELSRYLPNNQHELLPLPSDMPLLGKYRTNFEDYKSRQSMPKRLDVLNRTLPKQHLMIHTQARTADTGRRTVNQTINAYNQGQATLAATLEALRLCSEVQTAFVDAVNDYNQSTTEYALSVAPMGQSPQTVASMLIKPSFSEANSQPEMRQALNNSIYSNGGLPPAQNLNERQPANQSPAFQPSGQARFGTGNARLAPNNQLQPSGGQTGGLPTNMPPSNGGNTFRR